jgi:hypothetical protein
MIIDPQIYHHVDGRKDGRRTDGRTVGRTNMGRGYMATDGTLASATHGTSIQPKIGPIYVIVQSFAQAYDKFTTFYEIVHQIITISYKCASDC